MSSKRIRCGSPSNRSAEPQAPSPPAPLAPVRVGAGRRAAPPLPLWDRGGRVLRAAFGVAPLPFSCSPLATSQGAHGNVPFHDLVDTMSQDIVDTC